MTMTRQHFALIAEALASTNPGNEGNMDYRINEDDKAARRGARLTWECVVREMCDKLRATNPSFNPSRFLKACGVEG